MRLADHMLAAPGTPADLGGFATSMAPYIKQAQRFEISDEVALACFDLLKSKPSALVAALPLCRIPYETMWVEYRGGLGEPCRNDRNAPVPKRQGALIESMQGQVGFITLAWVHSNEFGESVNISPIAIYFDWREDGNVTEITRDAHRIFLERMPKAVGELVGIFTRSMEVKWFTQASTPADISRFFTGHSDWSKFAGNQKEIEAMLELDRHCAPGLSYHGAGMVAQLMAQVRDEDAFRHILNSWHADVQGEAVWLECLLAMLNSRNPVVEHRAADLTKLNRARVRRGRTEFLPYNVTRLTMSRSQQRIADARGVSRDAARRHLVRGHFKVRKTGVYWWAPFLRGDATRGQVERKEYEVMR
jgi:hypothetical protein